MLYDDGDRLRIDGSQDELLRGNMSPEDWARIPLLWKAQLLTIVSEKPAGMFVNCCPACQHCGEPVLPHEQRAPILNAIMHFECGFRLVGGSVGHQQKNCYCYGKTDTSELGISKREAARRSLAFYRSQNERISR
jgi:hypothetical protein